MDLYNRASSEAETILEGKDVALVRWREEGRASAERFEALAAEQAAEIDHAVADNAALRAALAEAASAETTTRGAALPGGTCLSVLTGRILDSYGTNDG